MSDKEPTRKPEPSPPPPTRRIDGDDGGADRRRIEKSQPHITEFGSKGGPKEPSPRPPKEE